MAKALDLISFLDKRKTTHALIVSWSGKADAYATILYRDGGKVKVRPMFESQWVEPGHDWNGLILLSIEDAESLQKDLAKILKSKDGKEAVRGDGSGVTARIDHDKKGKERTYWKREASTETYNPTRHGSLPSCQEPMKTAGNDGHLKGHMSNYIARHDEGCGEDDCAECAHIKRDRRWAEMDDKALAQLRERSPLNYEVYMAHMVDLERLTEIAQRMGLNYQAIQSRWRRADGFMKERFKRVEPADEEKPDAA